MTNLFKYLIFFALCLLFPAPIKLLYRTYIHSSMIKTISNQVKWSMVLITQQALILHKHIIVTVTLTIVII